MSDNYRIYLIISVIIIISTVLYLISYNSFSVGFPSLEYASDRISERLVPLDPFDNITVAVSHFLWDNKSLDLISQAFVLLAAVICSIALMKQEDD